MEIKNERTLAYSEVYEIINKMGKDYKDKIPNKLKLTIIEEMDKSYKPNIDVEIPLKKQNIHKKTYDILGMLQLNYWCKNESEKKELIKKFSNNDKIREEEIYEKYNPDNIFKRNEPNRDGKINETKELVKYEESKLKTFFDKILHFLHIKK